MTTAKSAKRTSKPAKQQQTVSQAQCGHMTSRMVFGVYREVSIVEAWGSDPRYGRCKRCGAVVADTRVSARARTVYTRTKRKAAPAPSLWEGLALA